MRNIDQWKRVLDKKIPKIYGAIVSGVLLVLLLMFSICVNLDETLIAVSLIAVLAIFLRQIEFDQKIIQIRNVPIILFLVTFMVRYSYCCIFEPITRQTSDFGITLWEAQSGSFVDMTEYYRYYLHKFFYPFFLHLFGFRTQSSILFLQCVLASFIPVILYFIGKKIQNEKLGLLAAGAYIIWPSQIFYMTIISEEHLAALITVLIVFLLIDLVQKIENNDSSLSHPKKLFGEFVLVGLSCGLSAFLKDWAIIVLIAVAVCALYLLIKYDRRQRCILIAGILLMLFTRSMVQTGISVLAESKLGIEANNGVVTAQMYVSLDPEGKGLWDPERLSDYQEIVRENEYNFSDANKQAMQELIQKIKDNLGKMPSFLLYKGTNAYSDDADMLTWALDNQMNPDYHQYFIGFIFVWKGISNLIYVFFVLCLCISAITLRNKYVFFIELIVVGSILSGLLIECQGRYKYSIEPIWCVLIANAIYVLARRQRTELKSFYKKK